MKLPTLAIIGTGISGLGAAHFLKNHFQITLFEKNAWVGGHAQTVTVHGDGQSLPIDVGFIVYNEVTYPLLTRLFREIEVPTRATTMSFSVQYLPDHLEYNGAGWNKLFGQRRNLLRRRFWKMLFQIDRFHRETLQELESPRYWGLSLKEYVAQRGYGDDFFDWYLSPMASAVWSSPAEKTMAFPAHTLMQFWHNHGFLGMHTHYPWRTVIGGSQEYLRRLTQPFKDHIYCGEGVAALRKVTDGIEIDLASGQRHTFDYLIVAAHADQALKMLLDPTPLEEEILTAFPYQKNHGLLHTSESIMPRHSRCWGAWNYRVERNPQGGLYHSTHYWMNELQKFSASKDYFVSLNLAPPTLERINAEQRLLQLEYEHPLFDNQAVTTQKRLHELYQSGDQTRRYFCGAWQRYGFHEDGLLSAYRLAHHILKTDPWQNAL